ncbi:unnamed protein product [Peronospora belbahrii]|uniref:FYVE-type domain-containing protein n=1 Tax=Peronospora belbahrii TaxID=622444 RepID=A0AAU9KM92_9STRA|nr:unnamed protein product [Peronospora belbahrii]CAH0518552.1 unnamed protein product [Peronospora belbahrii]
MSLSLSSSEHHWLTTSALRQPEFRPIGIPLSPGCYQATSSDRERYTNLIHGRVNSLLKDEAHSKERRERHEPFLHPDEWKEFKKEKDLRFYRRLQRGRSLRELALEEELPEIQRAVERGYMSLICHGGVNGSIEEILYGMTASSQDDLMTGFSYKNPPKDCVWLGSIETPSRTDPFHTADMIWALPKLPAILDQVDVCYLKATGQQVDANGERYGYLILHGVHIAQCPPFAAHGISRAKMYFACLFREPRPGLLQVTVRGIFDLSKKVKMLTRLVSAATSSFMVGLLNGVGIGQAKKLTLLARRNRSTLHDLFNAPRQLICYMCCKRASFLGRANLFGTHLTTCYICGGTVCSNCTRGIKQRIFMGTTHPCSKVDCCPNCVREAITTIQVRPNEPEFQIVAEYYLNLNQHSSSDFPEFLQNTGMKTNASAGVPTTSTTNDSLEEYQLEFENDSFLVLLDLPELRRSSGEDVTNVGMDNIDPDSGPEAEAGSFESSISIWGGCRHRISIDDEDFIPSTASDRMYSDRLYANAGLAERVEQRLLELDIRADHTYTPTEETRMIMQHVERR